MLLKFCDEAARNREFTEWIQMDKKHWPGCALWHLYLDDVAFHKFELVRGGRRGEAHLVHFLDIFQMLAMLGQMVV